MDGRDPRCVFVSHKMGEAVVVASALNQQGFPAKVMDEALAGDLRRNVAHWASRDPAGFLGRLEAAAMADFVVALYNPRSVQRQAHLAEAAGIFLRHRSPETPVFTGRNLGRDGEEGRIVCLSELAGADVDMLTIVLVGGSRTRRIDSDPARLYTPRGYFDLSF